MLAQTVQQSQRRLQIQIHHPHHQATIQAIMVEEEVVAVVGEVVMAAEEDLVHLSQLR